MINNTVKSPLRQGMSLANLPLPLSPAFITAVGVLLITIIALFTAPYVGMADNGDFFAASIVTEFISICRIMTSNTLVIL